MTPTGSSGDLAADRRYHWALGAAQSRDFEAARDLFGQVLDLAPHWAPAWFGLGESLEGLGRRAEAAAAFREALARDPGDCAGAALRLARLSGESPASAPRAYVKTLFDQYAEKFDRHLTEVLAYRGPQILLDSVEQAAPGRAFAHMLDLGCGAGLAGEAFRAKTACLTGVDLAPSMIAKARAKSLYDRLVAADLLDFLGEEPAASADLAVAADVFVYTGDLDPIFAAVARVLIPGGLFAFTAQSLVEGAGFRVGDDLRFAHSETYVRDCAAKAGLGVRTFSAAATRKDRGADVPGWAVVLAK
ncbi:methyltransferase domain-containing protein [Rhodoblastus sp.]|uniref:class I SAM-dependent DNA methyltransferase n=1 Tax=Rhodoblastus sp. TaxID=1962975 RepID=UPI002620B228|nr:methyltransferase domain-containing protein [Rhodoblastus sp.]